MSLRMFPPARPRAVAGFYGVRRGKHAGVWFTPRFFLGSRAAFPVVRRLNESEGVGLPARIPVRFGPARREAEPFRFRVLESCEAFP